jgi:hypothetical protein
VEGEKSTGAPYCGIIMIENCSDVTVKNVLFSGHRTYKTVGSAGKEVSMGTYDITVTSAVNVTILNCTQTNDINDRAYWGVFASNYAKNICFEANVFSRFDAHKGVFNVTLKNCRFGHQGINLIGSGRAYIENTTVTSSNFVNLRADYGSTWDGELVISNCIFFPKNGEAADAIIINGLNGENHDFGYRCSLPRKITIEGLAIKDKKYSQSYEGPRLFADINPKRGTPDFVAKYPIGITEIVMISRFSVSSGLGLIVSDNTSLFYDMKINYKD